jgi:hypothetical protein
MSRQTRGAAALVLSAGLLGAAAAAETAAHAPTPKEAPPAQSGKPQVVEAFPAVPIRYTGTIMYMGTAGSGIVKMRITVEKWTTNEVRKELVAALKTGGTTGLVAAMEKINAGYIQLENNLRWPVRTAAIWKAGDSYKVRFATDRPIYWGEFKESTRSLDYPIGIIELTLPPEGKGEGKLIAATQANFDENNNLEVKSLPTNTGPQRVTNVEIEKM